MTGAAKRILENEEKRKKSKKEKEFALCHHVAGVQCPEECHVHDKLQSVRSDATRNFASVYFEDTAVSSKLPLPSHSLCISSDESEEDEEELDEDVEKLFGDSGYLKSLVVPTSSSKHGEKKSAQERGDQSEDSFLNEMVERMAKIRDDSGDVDAKIAGSETIEEIVEKEELNEVNGPAHALICTPDIRVKKHTWLLIQPANLSREFREYAPPTTDPLLTLDERACMNKHKVHIFTTGGKNTLSVHSTSRRMRDTLASIGNTLLGPFSKEVSSVTVNNALKCGVSETSSFHTTVKKSYRFGLFGRFGRSKPWFSERSNGTIEHFTELYPFTHEGDVFTECVEYAITSASLAKRQMVRPDGKIADSIVTAVKDTVLRHKNSPLWLSDQNVYNNTITHITNQVLLRGLIEASATPEQSMALFRRGDLSRMSLRIDPSFA